MVLAGFTLWGAEAPRQYLTVWHQLIRAAGWLEPPRLNYNECSCPRSSADRVPASEARLSNGICKHFRG